MLSLNNVVIIIVFVAIIVIIYKNINRDINNPIANSTYHVDDMINIYQRNKDKVTYNELWIDNIKSHGPPILTKSIVSTNSDSKILLQITLFEDGFTTIHDNNTMRIIELNQIELKEIIDLKNQTIIENPHCCPDYDSSSIIGVPFLYFHDIDKSYCTYGSCLVKSMISFYKLDNILKKINNNDDNWI